MNTRLYLFLPSLTFSFEILFTASIFYIAISGLVKFSKWQATLPSPEEWEEGKQFGIDKVSGFYGPGNWAAWLLTLGSCCLKRLRIKEKKPSDKFLHIVGLDMDPLLSYAYPIIAAIDILELGSLAASGLVFVTGLGFGSGLALMCVRSNNRGMLRRRTASFSLTGLLFLWLVYFVLFFAFIYSVWHYTRVYDMLFEYENNYVLLLDRQACMVIGTLILCSVVATFVSSSDDFRKFLFDNLIAFCGFGSSLTSAWWLVYMSFSDI